MANTYELIEAKTLASAVSTVTFSSIPGTYTDLKLFISARADIAQTYTNIMISFNGSSSNITWLGIYGYISGNGTNTNGNSRVSGNANGTTTTANTFSNVDIYIPNYTSSLAKIISVDGVIENNASEAILTFDVDMWNPATQAAINSIGFTNSAVPAVNFLVGSTFYLYGIKNS